MIRKRTVTQTVLAAVSAPAVLAAMTVLAMVLFAGCSSPYSSPNWPYGSGGGEGSGGLNPLSMDTTPPGVVTHLAVHTGAGGSVFFSWQDPADDDFVRVEIWVSASKTDMTGASLASVSKGTMSYTGGPGTPGAVLYYHFISVDKSGNRSPAVNYKVTLIVSPVKVTGLMGMTDLSLGSVTLTWTDPVSPTFTRVDITHNQSGGTPAQPVSKGAQSYTWNGLTSGTVYTFTVRAVDTVAGEDVLITLKLSPDETPPGPVGGLSAYSGFGSVKLDWTSPGDADTQYVEISCDPFSGPAQTINAPAGSYTWNGLAGGVTYTFTVKAVDDSGNRSAGVSVTGTPADYTPPGPVTSLAGIPGDGCIAFIWTDPGDADLDYIQIDYGMGQQGAAKGAQTYTWSGITNGASYTFTFKAADLAGNRSQAVTVGPLTPFITTGGNVTYTPVDGYSSLVWKIHTFDMAGTYSLDFSPSVSGPVTADYLIVAGGSGAGGDQNTSVNTDFPGGGGAGGLMYKTGATLSPQGGALQISVGSGGAGGALQTQGGNGGDSAIGTMVVPGGGGGGGARDNMTGQNGGSGGGGGASGGSGHGNGGVRSSSDPDIKGNPGGVGSGTLGSGSVDSGGGGGGAGTAGANGNKNGTIAAGGTPWIAANNNAAWVSAVTGGTTEFSRGGNSGGTNAPQGGRAGVNYGDGGSAGNNRQQPGGAGHDGVVVIRFQRPALAP